MGSTIAIVGAGRVGRALGRSLRVRGWTIGAVVTRSFGTARSAVRAIGGGHAHGGVTRRVLDADVVLIATPDDAVRDVAVKFARAGGEEWRGRIVLHTSGALDDRVLEPFARVGAATGAMHPLQTFSGRGAPVLEGVAFVIEGDRRAQKAARRVARALGGAPVMLRRSVKPSYHAAATFAAPYVLALFESATLILMRAGFRRQRAKLALLPLIRQTLANYEHLGARKSWTGPVARGDYSTVARHRAALASWPEEFPRAYAALARLSARVLASDAKRKLRQLDRVLPKR
ncbi:MAG TPA: Rossmann-like and DUF2520 domain-containing protein [Candidatus Acidoferrales bacterium]|nr:Rossmann-like and DUF2520 domain-containing protein [Candidatus Acidoferrales bacterium]